MAIPSGYCVKFASPSWYNEQQHLAVISCSPKVIINEFFCNVVNYLGVDHFGVHIACIVSNHIGE